MTLTSADKSAIKDMIKAALGEAVAYDPFIPRIEAAKYLGVSEREFDELRARDEIATEQHGSRKVIVRLSELNRYAQERRKSA
ncbi:helix-turn-helix domain-containing protein [Mycobacteroides abscessus]|uniref:helix-turn-helix domain-containing protein n=1 Tax=Mycobacteroides abscessus TaxID=36809 RepID=UPI0018965587